MVTRFGNLPGLVVCELLFTYTKEPERLMDYIKVASRGEFDSARFKRMRILARNIAIFKDDNDSFFAIEVNCKHQNADLTAGTLDGDLLTCPRHGWTYDIRTGACVNYDSAPLRRFDLKIEGDDIYISIHPVEA